MLKMLVLLNFILCFLAFFCIILLYMRQNRLTELEKKQETMMKEMDDLFSAYMTEMKDENEKFLREWQSISINKIMKKEEDHPLSFKEKKIDIKIDQPVHPEIGRKEEPSYPKGTVFQAVKAYSDTKNMKVKADDEISIQAADDENAPSRNKQGEFLRKTDEERTMESLLKEAQEMRKQGFSLEEIAKRLDRGKTEIELLLKFHQNEQE